MAKKIGVVGVSGRMGSLLVNLINASDAFELGYSIGSPTNHQTSLVKVFKDNNYVIDFSSPELIPELLTAATSTPKPLVICTTGWNREQFTTELAQLATSVPIVIASNTSLGATLQRYLAAKLAEILNSSYDIDIFEKHHRHKADSPSGTALSLFDSIKQAKHDRHGLLYEARTSSQGKRPDNCVGLIAQRSGSLPGEHEVSFTSADESISIKHVGFDRKLFAVGALKIVEWLCRTNPPPGIYGMSDVLGLSTSDH